MRFLFRLFKREQSVQTKLSELEKRMAVLKMSVHEKMLMKQEGLKDNTGKKKLVPRDLPTEITIEHLQVEQIKIEKAAYANNIGQLGIDDLSGKLNIGTSYEGNFAKEIAAKLNNKFEQQAERGRFPKQG